MIPAVIGTKLAGLTWKKLGLKALPYILVLAAVIGTVWAIYSSGFTSGAESIQSKWNIEKLENEKALTRLREDAHLREQVHQQETQRISNDLAQANQKHAVAVATLDAEFAKRLSNSEQRATHYQRMSNSDAAERANLASHAAKLDRSLEEGRRLVQELAATVEQRDAQLRALAQQLLSDRVLAGGNDEHSSTSTE